MTAQTPGCGSTTDAKKRQREAETAREPSGLEAVLAEHMILQLDTYLSEPARWSCSCGETGAGLMSPYFLYCAHLAAVIREWLLSVETVERAAEGMVWPNWPGEPIQDGDRRVARAALAAAVEGRQG